MSSPAKFSRADLGFGLTLLAGAMCLATLTLPQAGFLEDPIAFLEGVRRLADGERLGGTFASPIGPAAFFAPVLWARLGLADGGLILSFAGAMWFLVTGALAWWRTSTWPSLATRIAFALAVALAADSPHRLGSLEWTQTTFALNYNAVALALAVLASLEVCTTRTIDRTAGLLIGTYAAFLFWIKFTNVLCLLPLGFGLWVNSPGARMRSLTHALLGAGIATGVIFLVAGFSPIGYFHDCLSMVASSGTAESAKFVVLVRGDLPIFLAAIAVAAVCGVGLATAGVNRARAVFLPLNILLLLLSLHLFASTKPALYLPLVLAAGALDVSSARELRTLFLGLVALAISPALAAWLYCGAWNLRYHAHPPLVVAGLAIVRPPPDADGATPVPRRLVDTKEPRENYAMAEAYRDAIELARPRVARTDTVAVADFTNPIVAAGLAHGMPGDWIAWHWRRNTGPLQLPWLRQEFPRADWVLTWKIPPALASEKSEIIMLALPRTHERVADSTWWILWRKRPASR